MTCCGIGKGGKQPITLPGFVPEKGKVGEEAQGVDLLLFKEKESFKHTNPGLILCLSQPP